LPRGFIEICDSQQDTPSNPPSTTFGYTSGTRLATLTMVFKLVLEAQKTWKRIKGYKWIPRVIEGVTFIDGEINETQEQVA